MFACELKPITLNYRLSWICIQPNEGLLQYIDQLSSALTNAFRILSPIKSPPGFVPGTHSSYSHTLSWVSMLNHCTNLLAIKRQTCSTWFHHLVVTLHVTRWRVLGCNVVWETSQVTLLH